MAKKHPRTSGPRWATQGLYEQVAGGVIAGIIVAVATVLMTENLWLGLLFAALAGTGAALIIGGLVRRRRPAAEPPPERPVFRTEVERITGPAHFGAGDIIVQQAPPPAPYEAEPELALSKVEGPPAFRVLTIVARPLDQSALPEIGDAWSLADRLAQVQAPIELAFARPPAVETLRRRLAQDWDVVHFDGHGVWAWTCPDCRAFIPKEEDRPDPSACPRCDAMLTDPAIGYLAFEQEDGLMDLLPATEMAALLCPEGAPPRALLVILTACQSAMGAPSLADVLLAAGVPAVLAMRETVTLEAIVALLPPFYANLGAGRTPRQALDAALPALCRLGENPFSDTPLAELPVLLGPGSDAPLCEQGCRAKTRVEREPLVGVPAPSTSGAFHGDFEPPEEPDDSPGGRKGYLVQLARAFLRGEKLVVLTGVGGIGKSALAAAAARRVAWRYPGGVFWVDGRDYLETGMQLENLLSIFGHVYGEEFGQLPVARQRELALAYLRRIETPVLMIVDNADVAGEEVFRFLREAPQPSAVLATTRTAPEYGVCVLDVVAMTPQEGLTFLAAEIGRRRNEPRWVMGIDELAAGKLLEIARLLDGHALALLQAAAQAGRMGLDYALAQVQANPARGETGRRFDFSYNPLPEPRKELLHRLAAFAAGFTLHAVETTCTDKWEEDNQLLTAWDADLPELVRASFVERHDVRFRLHPVMREYLRRKAGAEAMASHDRRFARYFARLAGWGRDQLGNTETALQAVMMATVERANLLAAQEACLAQELWDEAVSLAYLLGDLFERSGHWADRRRALEAGAEAAERGSDRREAALLANNLGIVYQQMGEYTDAREQYEASLRGLEEIGEERSIPHARALHQLGMLAQQQGDYGEARRFYQESLDINQQLGDRAGVAKTLYQLGMLAQQQGDYGEARRFYQESLDIRQQLGERAGVALSQWGLGNLAQDQGDYSEAERQWRAALATFHELGDRKNEVGVLHQLGMLAQATGDYAEARLLYQQAAETFEQLGAQQEEASVFHNLGVLAQQQGDYGEARRFYQESLDIAQQLGDRAGVAQTLHQLGTLAQAQGEYGEARRLYQQSLDIEQQLGNRAGVAITTWNLGSVAFEQGDYVGAERQWEAAIAAFRELGDRNNEAGVLHKLGSLAQAQGDYGEARRFYQESLDIEQQLGDRAGVASTLAQLALLEEAEGNTSRALELTRQAQGIMVELGNPEHIARIEKQRERLEGSYQRISGAD